MTNQGEPMPKPSDVVVDMLDRIDTQLARLNDMGDLTLVDAALVSVEARRIAKQLGAAAGVAEESLLEALDADGVEAKAFATSDGHSLLVERKVKVSVTGVEHDALRSAVLQHAARRPRVRPATGEVMSQAEAQLEDVVACFGFSPRWRELAKRGIDRDEYATVKSTPEAKARKL